MDTTALLLSRLQFAFTISFHVIFPAFTIGLAAWLTVLEALHLKTGRPAYRVLFDFWLKIFGVAFGLGVVSGIVMAFQFGTNWSVLSKMSGPIQGPLLSYETFTAFALEASFFGVLIVGRSRVPPWFYLFSTAMVALGTTLSAFWIMVNNSWMQVPVGYVVENGAFVPDDWTKIIFNSVVWVRFPHMLLGAYLTGAFCVAATGAWYLLRRMYHAEAKVMLAMGLGLAAVLVPVQLFFGHLNGGYVGKHQPSKMAAIEARWNDQKPASEVLIAWPDVENRRNLYAITLPPPFGSLIDSDSLTAGEVGLNSIPQENLFEPQRSHRAKPLRALACLSQLPTALHCHPHRLVHGGGGPSALGGLWRLANSRRNDAFLDCARGVDLAPRLRRRLHLHIRIRHFLHLPAPAGRPRWRPDQTTGSRSPQSAHVARR
jgi:cytochrome d ubiquinol oxidase subunit I